MRQQTVKLLVFWCKNKGTKIILHCIQVKQVCWPLKLSAASCCP